MLFKLYWDFLDMNRSLKILMKIAEAEQLSWIVLFGSLEDFIFEAFKGLKFVEQSPTFSESKLFIWNRYIFVSSLK